MTFELPNYIQANQYPARLMRADTAQLWDEGVMDLLSMKVAQRGAGANFSVDISTGYAIVQGDDQADQGNYQVRCTALENIAVSAAPGSNSRYDIICLRVYDANAGGVGTSAGQSTATLTANRSGFVHIAGTAAASPTVPATPASCLLLAVIGPIASGTASITTGLIADARPLAGRRCVPATLELTAGAVTGLIIPNGWLACNGSAVSRTTYARLFAAVGTAYGVGNGSSTFNIPDLRDRVPVAAGVSFGTLGVVGGEINHTLTQAELPAVTLSINPPNTAVSISDPGHDHPRQMLTTDSSGFSLTNIGSGGVNIYVDSVDTATTGISASVDIAPFASPALGSGASHNNMPPYLVVTGWLIRT